MAETHSRPGPEIERFAAPIEFRVWLTIRPMTKSYSRLLIVPEARGAARAP